jgi:hypothetical protein
VDEGDTAKAKEGRKMRVRGTARLLFFFTAFMGLILIMTACGLGKEGQDTGTPSPTAVPQAAAPTQEEPLIKLNIGKSEEKSVEKSAEKSFEIDPLQIVGGTPSARAAVLVGLINIRTKGFARVFAKLDTVKGETPEESVNVYNYVLMVYGDVPQDAKATEEYLNKVLGIVKQVVVYSAKLVADANEQSIMRVQISYPNGEQDGYAVSPNATKTLRISPSEAWLQFVQPIPLSVVASDEWQQLQLVNAAFEIAVEDGYVTQEEFNKIVEKLNEQMNSQSSP